MIWYKVTYKPFNSKFRNRCKVYNEIIIFLATENLIFFTDYMLTWDHHWGAGWIFIIIISTFLLLQLLGVLWDCVIWLYLLYLRWANFLAYIFAPCLTRLRLWWMKYIEYKLWLFYLKLRSLCGKK